jgi:hypothetical protein
MWRYCYLLRIANLVRLGFLLAGASCFTLALLIAERNGPGRLGGAHSPVPDKIIDIWINRMQGYFFVFLPDHTARIYESYSFDLVSAGKWQKVEDRSVYPESPKIGLPSYKAEFDDARVIDVFLYSIFRHYSIVVEDKITGRHGYNRLADTDDPNRFYQKKFTQGLPRELSIVNSYWRSCDRSAHLDN